MISQGLKRVFLPLSSVALLLAGCSGQPQEFKDSDDYTADELFEGKKPIITWGKKEESKAKASPKQPQVISSPYPQNALQVVPLTRKEGTMSFEEWKKAKEQNTQEYQDYLEYLEYFRVIQSQPQQ